MSIMNMAQAICLAQKEEMERDPKVFILGEDVAIMGGSFAATKGLLEQFGPQRVVDTPIIERGFTSLAVGAAMVGLRPIVEFCFMDFITVGIDPIINSAAKLRFMTGGQVSMPIVFRAPGGMLSGGAAQHTQSLEALFTHIPGLIVICPSTPDDARGLLKSAIRENNPVLFVEPKNLYFRKGEVTDDPEYCIPIGEAKLVKEGNAVSLISYGPALQQCVQASEQLRGMGIDAEILDLRTLSPLDEEAIFSTVKKTRRAVIVTEAVKQGSVGSEIVARISTNAALEACSVKIRQLGADMIPMPYQPELEKQALVQLDDIVKAVKEIV